MVGKIGEADRAHGTEAEDEAEAEQDEGDDGDDLDDGEPVFEFTKVADLHGVDGDEAGGYADDPDPLRNRGEPHGTVNGDCGDLGSDGDNLDECVGGTNGKAGP